VKQEEEEDTLVSLSVSFYFFNKTNATNYKVQSQPFLLFLPHVIDP
jgi:hypothetical protein